MAKTLQPVPSRNVLVTKRGATADGTQAAVTSVAVHSGALRFAANDVVCLADDPAQISWVSGTQTSDTTLVLGAAIDVTDGDRIVNLGADSSGGMGTPQYDGASVTIYTEPTTSGTAATNSQVQTNAEGEYSFWIERGVYDIHIMDANGALSANSQTLADVAIGESNKAQEYYVDGIDYPLTVAGVQAALDAAGAANGGTVYIRTDANILMATTSIKIPNRVRLVGLGPHFDSTPTFRTNGSTNVSAIIENETQDGTQQYAAIERLHISGSGGGTTTTGVKFVKVFDGSYIRDCLITTMSGKGVLLDGGNTGFGPFLIDNCTIYNNGTHNVHMTGASANVMIRNATLNTNGSASTAIALLFDNPGESSASVGHVVENVYIEQDDANQIGIHLDTVAACNLHNIVFGGDLTTPTGIKIENGSAGSNGLFGSSGHVLRNIYGNLATLISDVASGVTIDGNDADGGIPVAFYVSPVFTAASNETQIIGLQSARGGGVLSIASGVITPTDGNFFTITAADAITDIAVSTAYTGKMITLQFTNVSPGTLTHGNNIVLAGAANFSPATNDAITLICSGTKWIEASPR